MPSASLCLILAISAPALGLSITTGQSHRTHDALWIPQGCYIDSVTNRALSQDGFYDTDGMTVQSCLDYCTKGGYSFAGLEYARECFCSHINVSPGAVDAKQCSQPCSGDQSEICGGPNRLSMYLSTAAEPGVNPGVHGFVYAGCYADSVAARVLSRHATVPGGAANMSVAACTGACRAMGYALAGVEWAGECFCDDRYRIPAGGSENCDMGCRGNASEVCGGSLAINIYRLQAAEEATPATAGLTSAAPTLVRTESVVPILTTVVPVSTTLVPAISTNTTTTTTTATTTALLSSSTVLPANSSTPTTTTSSVPLPRTNAMVSPVNLIANSFFNSTPLVWTTVADPSYPSWANLSGTVATSGNTSAYIMATTPTRTTFTRAICIQQRITVSNAGVYRLVASIGRQVLNTTATTTTTNTSTPTTHPGRLRYDIYWDTTLASGSQNVCDPSLRGCGTQGAFGRYDTVTYLVQVPHRDIGDHDVAVCGVFSGDASEGLDGIVIYQVSFTGPAKGGR